MTAKEIREIPINVESNHLLGGALQDIAFFLREIAAQLAEKNEQRRPSSTDAFAKFPMR